MSEINEQNKLLAKILDDTIAHAANEALILAKLEVFLGLELPQLASSEDGEDVLSKSIDSLVRLYGGPPPVVFQGNDDAKPRYDTYLSAALEEVRCQFDRTRNSLSRARAFHIGMRALEEKPNLLNLPEGAPPAIDSFLLNAASSTFWEHAESCYIRLASYWDRVGQVLDFAFFGIRQYERDGFSAVLERIRLNTLRMHPEIENLPAWKALLRFKKSDQPSGLQWLLSRRNLLVHSMHLRPVQHMEQQEFYESAYNHLDERLREKLKVGNPESEIAHLLTHLSAAAKLFNCMITLCQHYAPHSPMRTKV